MVREFRTWRKSSQHIQKVPSLSSFSCFTNICTRNTKTTPAKEYIKNNEREEHNRDCVTSFVYSHEQQTGCVDQRHTGDETFATGLECASASRHTGIDGSTSTISDDGGNTNTRTYEVTRKSKSNRTAEPPSPQANNKISLYGIRYKPPETSSKTWLKSYSFFMRCVYCS